MQTVQAHRQEYGQLVVWLLLAGATLGVFWPVVGHDFISYDDPVYVGENAHMQSELTWENLRWAFTNLDAGFWQPLTWLSLLLDRGAFGLRPGGYHLTNLLLHVANSLLLFLVLKRMTGALWRSALVAALFALHPLQVESVAWVAERKGLLCAGFWMLALLMYARYVAEAKVQSPKPKVTKVPATQRATRNPQPASRFTHHVSCFYLLSLLFFLCGLMSKTMVVTLPCVLLLLDYWPLRRFDRQRGTLPRLLWEKAPFLAASLIITLVTLHAEKGVGALSSAAQLELPLRIHNALIAYVRYIAKLFWPENLAVLYPHPLHWPLWQVLACAGLLLAVSAAALALARRRPYLAVGWLWFIGTLVPVIGLVQVGPQAMADRYAYLPLIGLLIAVVWGVAEAFAGWPRARQVLAWGAAVLLLSCAIRTSQQVRFWQNTETLFRHALQVTKDNYLAYDALGTYCAEHGRLPEAIENLQKCLAIRRWFEPLQNLGRARSSQGDYTNAIACYQEALRFRPNLLPVHSSLADLLARSGQLDEAIAQYQFILRAAPDNVQARNNLGIALTLQGHLDEAIRLFREVLRADPNQLSAHGNLAYALAAQNQFPEAAGQYREVLRLAPDDLRAHQGLASALAELGQLADAAAEFTAALRLNPDDPALHYQLGLVLERQGKRPDALAQFQEALRLKPDYAEARHHLKSLLHKS